MSSSRRRGTARINQTAKAPDLCPGALIVSPEPSGGSGGGKLLCSVVGNNGNAVSTYETLTQYKLKVENGTGASCSNCFFTGVDETGSGKPIGLYTFTPIQVGSKTVGADCQCEDNNRHTCSTTITVVQGHSSHVCQNATDDFTIGASNDNGNFNNLSINDECVRISTVKTCFMLSWQTEGTGIITVNNQVFNCNVNGQSQILNSPSSTIEIDVPTNCKIKSLYASVCQPVTPFDVTCNEQTTFTGICNQQYGPSNLKLMCGGNYYKKATSQADNNNILYETLKNGAQSGYSGTKTINCYDDSGYSNEVSGTIPCATYCSW